MRDLQPLNLTDAALKLGVSPFDLMRLAVGTDTPLDHLQFDDALLDELRAAGGIEESWWGPETEMPTDHNERRRLVRAALAQLIARGHVDGEGTRMDNVWRGLDAEQQELLREALSALAEDELLALHSGKTGTHVTVTGSGRSKIEDIADGTADTSLQTIN